MGTFGSLTIGLGGMLSVYTTSIPFDFVLLWRWYSDISYANLNST